ncbi:MAG: SCP2 sterol-binding domain-containing protein [Clostridiales bacterium]|jgi:putative sterol carrier protein/multimeric flavodoxin WrbA|nr:SCP2 sterol-binding domain-containing protein [Clostridiales bacterium]
MKIISINGAAASSDFGLKKINVIIYETLAELGVEVEEITLAAGGIAIYDGEASDGAERVMRAVEGSNGVILTMTSSFGLPSALMTVFLEHLAQRRYENALADKNCMTVVVSRQSGEQDALEHIARVICALGGYDAVRVGLNSRMAESVTSDEGSREIVERHVEDYYRMIRQNRKFFPRRGASVFDSIAGGLELDSPRLKIFAELEKPKLPAEEAIKKLNLDEFTQQQERDIHELTEFFARKYSLEARETAGADSRKFGGVLQPNLMSQARGGHQPAPRVLTRPKTCRQMTGRLPLYFQPQLAQGINAIIQINVEGEEKFSGYISISNEECEYKEGTANTPDITITAESAEWLNVLKGKHTAHKAFMIGQIKVRGNFVLLTKFDQLFKAME